MGARVRGPKARGKELGSKGDVAIKVCSTGRVPLVRERSATFSKQVETRNKP